MCMSQCVCWGTEKLRVIALTHLEEDLPKAKAGRSNPEPHIRVNQWIMQTRQPFIAFI